MMTFLLISALLLVVAILFVVLPLWRGNVKNNSVQRDAANLEIFRDQIAEMDKDLINGLLTQEMYEQGKQELQLRLLDEVEEIKNQNKILVKNPLKVTAIVLAFLLPVAAIGVYWKVGNHQAISQLDVVNQQLAEINALEDHLVKEPGDAESWLLLARTYSEFGMYQNAVFAYDRLTQLVPEEAQLWADYADMQAMAFGKTLQGKSSELLEKALSLDPKNFKALALSGAAAMERGDYASAVRFWQKLRKMIPDNEENAIIVDQGIQQARTLMAEQNASKSQSKSKVSGAAAQISGTVVLSETLKNKVSPDDTVFVLVRAAEGPKMPLAIVRKQVRDLPLKFVLDDSSAMTPQMKLSNFDSVVVIARISKSGDATVQSGDMQTMSAIISPGKKGLNLTIDQIVP